MSTMPGLASKGEKGKSRFQSLDINSLYKCTLGESLENKQQKSTLALKHGMQSLGKVPIARRPPANLPSLKSEHSGTDTAVSLVPSHGSGWGKQETTSSTTTVTNTTSTTVSSTVTSGAQLTAHQAAIALPVTTTIPPPNKPHPSVSPATADKSWSAVMTGNDLSSHHPPPYQSPQFQHEFPSLSSGDGVPPRSGTDTQYGPGPSLRPQTEGSWMQGGSRGQGENAPRSNSVPLGAPPQLSAPAGQNLPPQCRGFVPPFMCRGNNFPSNGHGNPPIVTQPPPLANNTNSGMRNRSEPRQRNADLEDLTPRPIIKEEELSVMDSLTSDMGWAIQDDIDYNEKLAFSDDESKTDKEMKKVAVSNKMQMQKDEKTETHSQDTEHSSSWSNRNNVSASSSQLSRNRHDDDDLIARRKHEQEIQSAVVRAKQRKEEEEKKYLESKIAAAKKLKELVERGNKNKRDKENDETSGTINPATVPTQPIVSVPILLPEWERSKSNSYDEDKPKPAPQHRGDGGNQSEFRSMTQIEGRNSFNRKDNRGADKDQQPTPQYNFSKTFQNDLPPRFLKQQQQQQQQQQLHASSNSQSSNSFSYENRWPQNSNRTSPNNRKLRNDNDDKDRDDDRYRRYISDDNYRQNRQMERKSSPDHRYDDYRHDYDYKRDKDDDKRDRPRDRHEKSDSFDSLSISRQNSEEWHSEKRLESSRYDRPQRPDSRDSRASRESRHSGDSARHSEPRDYISSWSECPYEEPYEEKKKEHRMQVPGPITKEKIEADDLKNEKRSLTQLKRGVIPEKKQDKSEKEVDDAWSIKRINKDTSDTSKAWEDSSISNATSADNLKSDSEKKASDVPTADDDSKKDRLSDKDEKKVASSRGRSDSQGSRNSNWTSTSNSSYRNAYVKKGTSSTRGGRVSQRSKDMLGTESDGSTEDNTTYSDSMSQRSPKPIKKLDKDDKNKDMKNEKLLHIDKKTEKSHREFIPRGEPSRHGRGGSSSFRGGRGGCKRIDGYGPPPLKSPFSSHNEDRDKKMDQEYLDLQDSKGVLLQKDGDRKFDDKMKGKKIDPRRSKPKLEGDISDNSDDSKDKIRKIMKGPPSRTMPISRRNAPIAPRLATDKRAFGGGTTSRNDPPNRQNSSGSLRGAQLKDKDAKDKDLSQAVADLSLKEEGDSGDVELDTIQNDSEGFQEVKSKKTGKIERPKPDDKQKPLPNKIEKDNNKIERKPKPTSQLSQQQIANIPSLMATPVNPPAGMQQPPKQNQYERPRTKLAPRFAKQRENNRKQQQQQQQGICDVSDMNKVNTNMYNIKDGSNIVQNAIGNAWEKPLSAQLRGNLEQDNILGGNLDSCKNIDQSQVHCQTTGGEDKTVLDGSKPLNTIIFENTNFKAGPACRRNDKPRSNKMEEGMDNSVFNKPISDLLNKNEKTTDIQMQLGFNKEDSADMKLDFFENEISHLTEDKSSKNLVLPRTIHTTISSNNNTISPSTADTLNFKIQSVKKVWDATVIDHNNIGQDDSNAFGSSFGPDPNALDPTAAFSKAADVSDENHEVYSPSPNNQNASNSTTNVCKVKPTQQVAGSAGQTILSTGTHQQHSTMVGPGLVGHPLSPPPMQPLIGAGVGLGQPPQQYTTNQHINYQASLGGNTQFGMPAIPSPPTVLYNSTQQLQAQTGLYGTAFQIDQSQVINSQGRSQYSQYSYGLGQAGSSPYSPSMFLQTAQPHAPPTAQAPPDIYPSMNNYRLPANAPFGQNQQLSNPTTVLISSTSNSLMSASVKPSNQQISAIGTKAGGVGQAYQQQSQQQQQLFMAYDPSSIPANYLQNTGVMQRGPGAPVQNNVVPGLQPSALQPSSSYYSGSSGGQTGYFQQPGSSTLQSAQMSQHQAGYGLQGSVFGTHNQSHTSGAMQNYGSPFISNPMQLAAAAMSAQQYRSANLTNQAYMKGVGSQQLTDQSGRQQLKSPSSQQEALSSVFNSGTQITSPKSRQPCKPPPPQPSPTAQHKYLYPNISNQQSGQRYPTPIQRPVVNFSGSIGSVQSNSNNPKHRTNNSNNRSTSRPYYGGQATNINTQSEKAEDAKLNESVPNTSSSNATTTATKTAPSVPQTAEKGDVGKEETCAITKD